MTMFSFRVEDADAIEVDRWAAKLGVDRSELLRDALRRYLNRLSAEQESVVWDAKPLDEGEKLVGLLADWGPAEDWSDWDVDEAG